MIVVIGVFACVVVLDYHAVIVNDYLLNECLDHKEGVLSNCLLDKPHDIFLADLQPLSAIFCQKLFGQRSTFLL